jgi:2-polyprenyl-3-methyl-5-hydroxy-6-metoxy-1,4-benzoquinol methylase
MIPDVLRLYSDTPPRIRARAWGRWASTPFAAVEAKVPTEGRILDVGCGFGVFSCYVGLRSTGRQVLGIDEELDDVIQARLAVRKAGSRLARVSFELTPPGEVPDGPWDAVVLIDGLGRLDPDAQSGLLATCAEQVALGGVLVINDRTGPRRRTVHEDEVAGTMEDAGLVVSHGPVEGRNLHRHHLFVGARRRSVR